MQAQDRKKI